MKQLLHAAERGEAEAQFNLGVLLLSRNAAMGDPSAGDRGEAIRWLRLAAQQGLARAQLKLAQIYVEAADAPRHYIKASAWFLLAAKRSEGAHCSAARTGFDRVAQLMSDSQVARARTLAAAWKPRPAKPITADT